MSKTDSRIITHARKASLVHLSVSFLPAVANFVGIVAKKRGKTGSAVVALAVGNLVDEVSNEVTAKRLGTYSHKLPAVLDSNDAAGSADQNAPAIRRSGPVPRYTKRMSAYVSLEVSHRLDELEDITGLSRAELVRTAVDKYLFEEIVTHLGTVNIKAKMSATGGV
ncbi:ribbon-helix-helix domain-containing protein [Rhodococcus sp. IEGM 1354]|uniref:ribbon-helix-helix domain-containing protein n=1 Tax=Rhodococcus sp. IEGM 1354 TaxID=3047088 RepID=UPI0024B676C9|nr:ribbon-helix-helix domain-containing protein [Rhodococcus sp. IEGM 1354]MDI9933161.1 ribbon-helix-helix domain-containing protein [Rhodococcus sp. IEGM 1354]